MAAIHTVWENAEDVPDSEQMGVLYGLSAYPAGVSYAPDYVQSQYPGPW